MHTFTEQRNDQSIDEIWLSEHYSIFTYGQVKNRKDIININNNILIEHSDRGGKITYHAPGQQIVYFLLDLKRRGIYPRKLINLIEKLIINVLKYFSIYGYKIDNLPGVYVNNKKICSVGLRIKNGCSLHGLSLNVNMNLLPFTYIYPCGNKYIRMTMMSNHNIRISIQQVKTILIQQIYFFFN